MRVVQCDGSYNQPSTERGGDGGGEVENIGQKTKNTGKLSRLNNNRLTKAIANIVYNG
jgi:hypothetical protein